MTGDQADQLKRLKSLLPPWFGDTSPLLDAVLTGVSAIQVFVYGLIAYAALQLRIATATGGWLDLIAYDFFGRGLVRAPGQSDDLFRAAIGINLVRPRATRPAIDAVLVAATGRHPAIIEPGRPQDTGGYGKPMMGYGIAGAYGSVVLAAQAFVTAYRPFPGTLQVTDLQIYAAVEATRPAGSIMWVRIVDGFTDPFGPDRAFELANGTIRFVTSDRYLTLPGWAS